MFCTAAHSSIACNMHIYACLVYIDYTYLHFGAHFEIYLHIFFLYLKLFLGYLFQVLLHILEHGLHSIAYFVYSGTVMVPFQQALQLQVQVLIASPTVWLPALPAVGAAM